MDTILLITLAIILVGSIAFIFTNKSMEKYRKYILILIPFVVFLLLYIFKRKISKKNDESTIETSEFKEKLNEVKQDLQEVNTIAEIKLKISEEKKEEDLQKLNEVTQIKDKTERRKKLAEMIG